MRSVSLVCQISGNRRQTGVPFGTTTKGRRWERVTCV